jgi:VWFA-related protein
MSRFAAGVLMFLSIVLNLSIAVRGQTATPATRLVQLNVVAVDAHGSPITDLKSDDFQVSDSGKPQHIVFFHHELPNTRTVALGPREYSNRSSASVAPATAILFDLLNSNLADRGLSTREIVRGLQHVEVADHVYLYLLTKDGKLLPVRGVPPASELGVPAGAWTQQISGALETALKTATQVKAQDLRITSGYIMATYSALGAVAAQMTILPGPKNIVWITQGVPISVRGEDHAYVEFTPKIRQFSAELCRANIIVNPVKTVVGEQLLERQTLELFADLTGGRAYLSNEVETAITQVTQNARATYRIGYYLAPQDWDGKFHKVKVTSTRNDAHIQAVQGYNADPSPDQQNREEAAAVTQARATPFDIPDIGLRATVVPATAASASRIAVRVEAADLALQQEQDRNRGRLAMVVTRFYSDGRQPETEGFTMDLDLTGKQFETAKADGISLGSNLLVKDKVEKIQLIVVDRTSKAVGSLTAFPEK